MNEDVISRVGRRQYAMLRAADDAYPDTISVRALRLAPADGMPPSTHQRVIDSLLAGGLLEHACPSDDHAPAGSCPLRITARGAGVRLARYARAAATL